MMFKSAVIFVTTSLAAVANCGLLGQITYADNSIYHQGGYNDATKVSYSSVSQPSVLSNYQQQYQAPVNNYQPAQPYNQYYSAQPAYNLQYSAPAVQPQPQQYNQYKSQYPAAQFIGPRSFSSAGEVSYSYSTGPGYSTSTGNHQQQQPYQQYAAQQPVSVQPLQQYSQLQRGAPIQHHHHQAAAPQKTIQYFPALPNPATTTNLGTYSPKNAHHYSAFATKSGSAYQTASINHQQPQQQPGIVHHSHSPATTLYQTPNAVFRSSFGTGVPTKPSSEIIPPVLRSPSHPTAAIATVAPLGAVPSPRIIQSTPHFTHSVTSTGGYQSRASSSSLAANPIHIPSSPAPVAAAAAAVQQYPQSHHRFSPSTAVSHAKFEGMGVRYEW